MERQRQVEKGEARKVVGNVPSLYSVHLLVTRQAEAGIGRSRKRQKEAGRDRKRQEEAGRDRKRQAETGKGKLVK